MKKKERTKASHWSTCSTKPLVMMVVACSKVVENWSAETVCVMEMAVARAKAVEPQSRPRAIFLKRDLLLSAFVFVSVFLRCHFKSVRKNSPRKKADPAAASNHKNMFVWRTNARLKSDRMAALDKATGSVVLPPPP